MSVNKTTGESNMPVEKEKATTKEQEQTAINYEEMYNNQKLEYEKLLKTTLGYEQELRIITQQIKGGINDVCLSIEKALNDMIDCSSETRFALLYAKELVKNIMSD